MRTIAGLLLLIAMAPSAHATLYVSPTSVNFYNVQVNSYQPPQTIMVQNGGQTATTLQISNTCFIDFTIENMCSLQLSPGQNCMIQVQFRPTNAGYQSCNIWIEEAQGGAYTVSVSGQGVAHP